MAIGHSCTAQSDPLPSSSVTVTGRVSLEKKGKNTRLILSATDAAAYLITGELTGTLEKIAREQAKDNLVTVTGNKSRSASLRCTRTNRFEDNENGSKGVVTEAVCVKYHDLDVRQIVSVARSGEPMPAPKRDAAAEAAMIARSGPPKVSPPDIGEIYGTITERNFKGSVKTIQVRNRDDQSPLRTMTLLITADTQTVKRLGEDKPFGIAPETLKPGQQVTVIYSRNDVRANALFITVTGK